MRDGCNYNVNEYVREKLKLLENSDRDMKSIFRLVTREKEKIFSESNDGYLISKITYGEYKERTEQMAGTLKNLLSEDCAGHFVGIYMNNCEEWLEIFWALLMLGIKPLLMNNRMSAELLEDIIAQYDVKAVISDGRSFAVDTLSLDDVKSRFGNDAKVSSENDGWANEIALTSSGTTSHVKLCIYNGETMYYQICDSAQIIQQCKQVKQHYENHLKLLTFLPFYHIFGLVAVFMWFSFFGCTFVFLKDFSADTILNTVRRHKVTHIFSIPLLWNTVYATVVRTAKERNEYEKLLKGVKLANKLSGVPGLGKAFSKKAFASVREQMFGDSIRFLISGGSAVSSEVLSFFNAVGYPISNGYGMTEIGIASVELSGKNEVRNSRSVGIPFSSVEYKLSEEGELLVKGETMADIVMEGGKVVDRTENGWFHTNDLAMEKDGRYFILGRKDDVIIGASGENLNPDVLEDKFKIEGAEQVCIVNCKLGQNKLPVLVVKVAFYASTEVMKKVESDAYDRLKELSLDSVIGKVIITRNELIEKDDFKLNRRNIAARIENGSIVCVDPEKDVVNSSELTAKVIEIMAHVLGKKVDEVRCDSNLMYDLGGTSLDYFTIVMELQKEFGVGFEQQGEQYFKTANEFAEYIERCR